MSVEMKKTDSSPKLEKKDEISFLPVSMLNQHISHLAKTLFLSEKKKENNQKKFHFPLIDLKTFKKQANHQLLLNEVFILVVRMEVIELKLAQLDRKISKKIKSLTPGKKTDTDVDKKFNETIERTQDSEPTREKLMIDLRENIKASIDKEFKKFMENKL